jgi:5'-nucleotidase
MKILLTNDDGINAPGLAALHSKISQIADTIVVAPDTEMSAIGHAISLNNPLRVADFHKNGSFFGYAVSGTPADCVKIAHSAIFKDKAKPNLLISGINWGSNTGINTIYSGTVSAATEGAILHIPSFAISLATYAKADFTTAAEFAAELALIITKKKLPRGVFLNVNVPAIPKAKIKGVKVTRQGAANYTEEYFVRKDPRERTYYWLAGEKVEIEQDSNVDDRAILENKISITPVHYDLTYYPIMKELEKWQFNF